MRLGPSCCLSVEGGMRDALSSILDQALGVFPWQSCQSSCSWRNHWFYWFNICIVYRSLTFAIKRLRKSFIKSRNLLLIMVSLWAVLRQISGVFLIFWLSKRAERTVTIVPFEENLSLEQDRLFQLIDLVTSALPEIKSEHILKSIVEMLTINCQETHSQMSQEIPGNLLKS